MGTELWGPVGEIWLSAALGERSASDAAAAMVSSVADAHGTAARFTRGVAPSPGEFAVYAAGERVGAIVFVAPVPAPIGERLARIVGALVGRSDEVPITKPQRHALNNSLAVLLASIEFAESLLQPDEHGDRALLSQGSADRETFLRVFLTCCDVTRELVALVKVING